MAMLIRPWLTADIETEIKKALSCTFRKQGEVQSKDGTVFENDGSNIRTRKTKSLAVQITEFQNFKNPVAALLSDSEVFVKAIFTAEAVKQYRGKHRQDFTHQKKGGLIQLLDFEIVASRFAPKSEAVTLLVHNFQTISGSDGSSSFGTPTKITSMHGMRRALEELSKLQAESEKFSEKSCEMDESRSSLPADDENTLRGGSINTQVGFSTQAPARNPVKLKRGYKKTPGFIPEMPDNMGLENSKDAPGGTQATNMIRPKATKASQTAALLSLVGLRKPQQANHTGLEGSKLPDQLHKPNPIAIQRSERRNEELEPPEKKIPLSRELKPLDSSKSRKEDTAKVQSRSPVKHAKFTTMPSVPAVDTTSFSGLAPPDQRIRQPMVATEKDSQTSVKVHVDLDQSLEHETDRENPWKGLEKIPRRQFIITKEQQQLLEDPQQNCWIPPEPGRRPPTANIPLKVLEYIRHEANEHANGIRDPPSADLDLETATNSSPTPTQSDFSEDKESSDVPISSADWPLSSPIPARISNRLPPDSSPGAPIELEDDMFELPKASHSSLAVQHESSHNDETEGYVVQLCDTCGKRYELASGSQHDCHLSVNGDGETIESSASRELYSLLGHIRHPANIPAGNGNGVKASTAVLDEMETRSRPDGTRTIIEDENPNLSSDSELEEVEPQPFQSRIVPTSPGKAEQKSVHAPPSPATVLRNKPIFDIQVERTPDLRGPWHSQSSPNKQLEERPTKRRRTSLDHMPGSDDRVPGTALDKAPQNSVKLSTNGAEAPQSVSHGSDIVMVGLQNSATKLSRTKDLIPLHPLPQRTNKDPIFRETSQLGDRDNNSIIEIQSSQRDGSPSPSPSLPPEKIKPSNIGERKRKMQETCLPKKASHVKRVKIEAKFDFSQDPKPAIPPEVLQKQYRDEFVKSLKIASAVDEPAQSAYTELALVKKGNAADERPKTPSPNASIHDEPEASTRSHSSVQRQTKTLVSISGTYSGTHSLKKAPENRSDRVSPIRSHTGLPVINLLSDEPFEKPRLSKKPSLVEAPMKQTTAEATLLEKLSLFQRFKEAYQEYNGSEAHFSAMCRNIVKLTKEKFGLHQSWWDDFIIRHRMEYKIHIDECNELAENSMPYEEFYIEKITERKFTKKVLTPATLDEALPTEITKVLDVSERRSSKLTTVNSSTMATFSRALKTSATIDLTSDNETPPSPQLPTLPKQSPGRRRLPWLEEPKSRVLKSTSSPFNLFEDNSVHKPMSKSSKSGPLPRDIPIPTTSNLPPYPPHAAQPQNAEASPSQVPAPKAPEELNAPKPPKESKKPKQPSPTLSSAPGPSSAAPAPEKEWWKDPYNPFKKYTRADASLRAGNGNSYAGQKVENVTLDLDEEKIVRAERKRVDFMQWEL